MTLIKTIGLGRLIVWLVLINMVVGWLYSNTFKPIIVSPNQKTSLLFSTTSNKGVYSMGPFTNLGLQDQQNGTLHRLYFGPKLGLI